MKTIIYNGVSIVFGLLFINGGLNKFLNYMPIPEDLPEALVKDSMAMMEIEWLMPLLGIAEIVGGLLILFPITRGLGAVILFPVLVGILLTHIFVAPGGLPVAVLIWAILLWILWENRYRYLALVKNGK